MINANPIGASMPQRPLTIVGLGDSTTAGTPAFRSPLESPPDGEGDPESQYAHWMSRAHSEWTVLNRGINGQTAAEIRSRFERDVLRARPAYVIILAGVNDIFRGSGAESVERELGVMYADALDASIVPVAASVLPYDLATPQATAAIFTLNMWIESFAKVLDIPFADTHAAAAAPSAPTVFAVLPTVCIPTSTAIDGWETRSRGRLRPTWPGSRHDEDANDRYLYQDGHVGGDRRSDSAERGIWEAESAAAWSEPRRRPTSRASRPSSR